MAVLGALAMAGLAYSTVLLPDFPQTMAQFLMEFAVKVFLVMGLASFVSLVGFSCLELINRKLQLRLHEAQREGSQTIVR